jgi:CDP-glycerol glycerophosphotransferase (TagB/SpsB family)
LAEKTIIKRLLNKIHILKTTLLTEIIRLTYPIIHKLQKNKREVWIIGESPMQAQENGYYLFDYILKNHSEINVFYVINQNAPQINKIRKTNKCLIHNSIQQIYSLFIAKKIISTHGLWMIPDEIGILKKLTRKTLNSKKVMLNHGIGFLKNGKKFYHKDYFPLNDLIIALSPLHKSIFTDHYGYNENDIKVTGYPRFDYMEDLSNSNKIITLMPTFRDGEDNLGEKFKETELYLTIKSLIVNKDFKNFLKDKNIKFYIYLHQNIQKYNSFFLEFQNENIQIAQQGEYNVQMLLQVSNLLITDYSSVLFDFAYMGKPFISYQFDYEKFINSRKDKAFIDFKKDLPGYIIENENQLIETIFNIDKNNYQVNKEHTIKLKDYFYYNDKNNCKRVFEAINKLEN